MNRKYLSSRLFLICAVALATGAAIIILSRIWPDDSPDKINLRGPRAENNGNGPNTAGNAAEPAETAQDPAVVAPKDSGSLVDGREDELFDDVYKDIESTTLREAYKVTAGRAGELEYLRRSQMDPNLAMVRSLELLKERYREDKERVYGKHERELLYAARKIAEQAKGTSEWPEAVLYLGLYHEANGHSSRSLGIGVGTIVELYQAALAASPPPDLSVRRQLQYRVAMHSLAGLWTRTNRPPEREKRINAAREALEQLMKTGLRGVTTMSGRPMEETASILLESCSAPHSVRSVSARLEIIRDVFCCKRALGGRAYIVRSIEDDLYSKGAEDYRRYLADASIPSSQKSSLEIDLAELQLDYRRNRERAIVHAENALRYAGNNQKLLQLRAKAVLAPAYSAIGQPSKASALAREVLRSKDFENLSGSRKQQIQRMTYK